jgi:putative transposase
MVTLLSAILAYLRAFVVSRHTLALEAVALRQQLAVYKRKQPRAKLDRFDRLFWVVLRRLRKDWSEALILVKPGTVVCWHRAGYRLFWRWRSRALPAGRPKVAEEVRQFDPPNEKGESDLGCTSHPWRVTSIGIRDF